MRSKSSSRWPRASRGAEHGACPHQCAGEGQARRSDRDQDAVLFVIAVLGAAAAVADIPLAERKSGYEFMARETRAMQVDESANPATLWVLDAETLWQRKEGSAGKSCADCHGDARTSMRGV